MISFESYLVLNLSLLLYMCDQNCYYIVLSSTNFSFSDSCLRYNM